MNTEPDQNAVSDQRYFPRWTVADRVFYKSESTPHPRVGVTKDLSCAGACLYLKDALTANEKLSLKLQLEAKTMVTLQGKVMWQKAEDNMYLTGVSFYETTDAAQEAILEHAFQVDRKSMVANWFKGWEGSKQASFPSP